MDNVWRLAVVIIVGILGPLHAGCITVNLPPGPAALQEYKVSGEGKDKILLMEVSGVISSESREGFYTYPSLLATIKEELSKAAKDDRVKAMVIRINSPGGTVTASPSTVRDHLRLKGDFTGTSTITFASPVVNPVFAIWNLGQPSLEASFTFDQTPTFEAGGPSSIYIGVPLSVLGNVVSGNEGNGVVQFTGTFSSISWTNTLRTSTHSPSARPAPKI